jgi:hypothetical protein
LVLVENAYVQDIFARTRILAQMHDPVQHPLPVHNELGAAKLVVLRPYDYQLNVDGLGAGRQIHRHVHTPPIQGVNTHTLDANL